MGWTDEKKSAEEKRKQEASAQSAKRAAEDQEIEDKLQNAASLTTTSIKRA